MREGGGQGAARRNVRIAAHAISINNPLQRIRQNFRVRFWILPALLSRGPATFNQQTVFKGGAHDSTFGLLLLVNPPRVRRCFCERCNRQSRDAAYKSKAWRRGIPQHKTSAVQEDALQEPLLVDILPHHERQDRNPLRQTRSPERAFPSRSLISDSPFPCG